MASGSAWARPQRWFTRRAAGSRKASRAGRHGTRTRSKSPDPEFQLKSIQAATEVARHADVAIVVVGENESTNREAWSENHLGDRDSLDLIGLPGSIDQGGGRDRQTDRRVPD